VIRDFSSRDPPFVTRKLNYEILAVATSLAIITACGPRAAPPSPGPIPGNPAVKKSEIPKLGYCGTTSDWVWEINQLARRAQSAPNGRLQQPNAVFTAQNNFPANQVVTCGKFRVYFEDLLQSNNDGFANPTVVGSSTLGQLRQNTLCAALNYIQSVFDFTHLAANDYIDLHVEWSYTSTNPAPAGTGFLAVGGPYYGSAYGSTAGYYGGYFYDHLTTNTDPDPNQYDGVVQVNFDHVYFQNGNVIAAQYWDDYSNTSATCVFDLFTVLLHEVTHAMGWLSNVHEDNSSSYYAQNTHNNSFTLLDKNFFYYGDAKTPASFSGNKLVIGGGSPSINPNFASGGSVPYPLRSNKIWMNNSGIPLNHPAYSGDFTTYVSIPQPPTSPGSLLSHLNDNANSFVAMSQYSPGFQPNYVMGPGIAFEQTKRQWTNFEMRALLTLGYHLDPVFASSTSLTNGIVTNQNLLLNNIPPQRALAQVTEFPQASLTMEAWAESVPATASIAVNNNTSTNTGASTVVINVSSLGSDQNGDQVQILPNSLFNIRGCGNSSSGNGGNNHNQLSVNTAGTQVTFTPRPGFRGRAQFGFYLWDKKEQGSFCVATIDVSAVTSTYISSLPPNHNKIMNGTFEEGTETRQRLLNEAIQDTGFEFYREGPFMQGYHLADNQPSFNGNSNLSEWAGGDYVYQSWKECNQINGGVKGNYGAVFSDFNSNGYTVGSVANPLGNLVTTPNERYHHFYTWNFFELITPTQQCRDYRLEMDLSWQTSAMQVGSSMPVTADFVANPYLSWPAMPAVLQSTPLSLPVNANPPNVWQHFSVDIPYCPSTAASFINLQTTPLQGCFVDNVSLTEITPPPFSVTASASPSTITAGSCSTLTAVSSGQLCTPTFTWQPGNLSGASVSVCPATSTTYTVTANDGCRTATAATMVTVHSCASQPPHMVSWWPLNETSGNTVVDVIGGYNGTTSNPIGSTDPRVSQFPKVTSALTFINSQAAVTGSQYNFGTGSFSIDAWVKGPVSNRALTVVDKLDTAMGPPRGFVFSVRNGKLQFIIGNGTATPSTFTSTTPQFTYNTWQHVAVTVQKTGVPIGRFYINGVPAGTFVPPPSNVTNYIPLLIGGSRSQSGCTSCEVTLDEVEIFSDVLSPSDIQAIVTADTLGKCP